MGQWLEIRTSFVKVGKLLCVVQSFITTDDGVIAKASGSFRILAQS